MYCGTLEVTARHPVPPQLLGGRLPHCCCLFRQEQPSGSQGTAATISLNASHGGTGDSQSGAGAVYTVSTCLLLTLGNLIGVQLYTKKQAIRMLSFTEIAAIEKSTCNQAAQALFGNIVIPDSGSPHKSCCFRKKVIKWNLDKFRLEFMGNNAESLVATAVVWFSVACFLAWTKQQPLYWQRYIPLSTPLRLDPLITPSQTLRNNNW